MSVGIIQNKVQYPWPSSFDEPVPWQCSMPFHASFEILILLLDLLKVLIQLHIFLRLGIKKKNQENDWLIQVFYIYVSSTACLYAQESFSSASVLTSLSISIIFFSCWWSCLFLISSTTLRLSSSCSRYRVWESFCGDKWVVPRCSASVKDLKLAH